MESIDDVIKGLAGKSIKDIEQEYYAHRSTPPVKPKNLISQILHKQG